MKSILFFSLMSCLVTTVSYGQYDTIYVSEKNGALLVFDSEFEGEIGNQDYVVTPKGNTLKIFAQYKNTMHSFLQIDQDSPKKQFFFIVAYRSVIKRTIYDYSQQAKKPEENGKIKFGSISTPAEGSAPGKETTKTTVEETGAKGKENAKVTKVDNTDPSVLYDSLVNVAKSNTFEYGIYATQESRMLFKLQSVLVYEDYFIFKILVQNNSSLKYVKPFFDIFLLKKENMLRKDLPEKDRLKKLRTHPELVESIDPGESKEFVVITNAKVSDGFKTLYFMLNNELQNRSMGFYFPTKELLKAKILKK